MIRGWVYDGGENLNAVIPTQRIDAPDEVKCRLAISSELFAPARLNGTAQELTSAFLQKFGAQHAACLSSQRFHSPSMAESFAFQQFFAFQLNAHIPKPDAEDFQFKALDGLDKIPKVAFAHSRACQDFIRRLATVIPAFIYKQEHAASIFTLPPFLFTCLLVYVFTFPTSITCLPVYVFTYPYFAYSTALVSRITVTRICPG